MNYLCEVCGNDFEYKRTTKFKSYCSDNCKNYNKFKNALERSLIALKPTKKASKLIRGDLFRLSNIVGKGTE